MLIPAIPGLIVVVMPAIVRMQARSIRTTTMVMRTTIIRGVGFLWRDYNIRVIHLEIMFKDIIVMFIVEVLFLFTIITIVNKHINSNFA